MIRINVLFGLYNNKYINSLLYDLDDFNLINISFYFDYITIYYFYNKNKFFQI
jgi:hypothetical protein